MGKKLRVQRRGKGSSTFKAAQKGRTGPAKYPSIEKRKTKGVVKRLVHESGRGAPLAFIDFEGEGSYYMPAPEGVSINQHIYLGSDAPLRIGNILPLGLIPEGTMICNIEMKPGDGGKIARSSGSFGTIVSHIGVKTTVKIPSKRDIELPNESRATIGIIAGGGRKEKPFMKSGEQYHMKKSKGHKYPITKGVSMTAASHPHGGGRHRRPGKSTTVSRHAPPGKKVGLIAARSSGKKKRRRRN